MIEIMGTLRCLDCKITKSVVLQVRGSDSVNLNAGVCLKGVELVVVDKHRWIIDSFGRARCPKCSGF